MPAATTAVVAVYLQPLIGRDLFDQLGLVVTQSSYQKSNQIDKISPYYAMKEKIALHFPNLVSRHARSKHRAAKSKFRKSFQA